jgi:hypothetical protein
METRTVEYDNLVSSVDVETLVEGKRDRIVVERRVGRRIMLLDGCVCQPSNELFNPPDTLDACHWIAKRRAIPSRIPTSALARHSQAKCGTHQNCRSRLKGGILLSTCSTKLESKVCSRIVKSIPFLLGE